jgi:hypothetical protein
MALQRAPLFLRVVRKGGEWDALDLLVDKPEADEEIFVYRLEGKPTPSHIYFGGGRGGWYMNGTYRFVDPQPADEDVRGIVAWRHWCLKAAGKDPTIQSHLEL